MRSASSGSACAVDEERRKTARNPEHDEKQRQPPQRRLGAERRQIERDPGDHKEDRDEHAEGDRVELVIELLRSLPAASDTITPAANAPSTASSPTCAVRNTSTTTRHTVSRIGSWALVCIERPITRITLGGCSFSAVTAITIASATNVRIAPIEEASAARREQRRDQHDRPELAHRAGAHHQRAERRRELVVVAQDRHQRPQRRGGEGHTRPAATTAPHRFPAAIAPRDNPIAIDVNHVTSASVTGDALDPLEVDLHARP